MRKIILFLSLIVGYLCVRVKVTDKVHLSWKGKMSTVPSFFRLALTTTHRNVYVRRRNFGRRRRPLSMEDIRILKARSREPSVILYPSRLKLRQKHRNIDRQGKQYSYYADPVQGPGGGGGGVGEGGPGYGAPYGGYGEGVYPEYSPDKHYPEKHYPEYGIRTTKRTAPPTPKGVCLVIHQAVNRLDEWIGITPRTKN